MPMPMPATTMGTTCGCCLRFLVFMAISLPANGCVSTSWAR
uniref:Uncharacterized protein n=1 Tax=Arundo donax TaxID=35708 RepID=A0A0A9A2F7_ARUDO